jgi:putative flippase GtrA
MRCGSAAEPGRSTRSRHSNSKNPTHGSARNMLSDQFMAALDRLSTRFPRAVGALRDRIVLLRKAISFGVIGVVNTAVDFGVFMFGIKVLALALVPANVLSWLVATSGSYAMNSFFTFAVESGRRLTWRDYATFVASGTVGVVANTVTLVIAASILEPIVPGAVPIAKLLAVGVSFVVNFSMSHFVVFRSRRQAASEPH